jgi:hypothetical protein
MEWLNSHPTCVGRVMEGVVRVMTRMGDFDSGKDGVVMSVREWRSLYGRNCGGRYVPAMATRRRHLHPQSCEEEEVSFGMSVGEKEFFVR